THPVFEDLKSEVMLSSEGQHIPFVFQTPDGEERALSIEPRKTKEEPNPVIGVRWPMEMKLPDKPRGPDAEPGPAMPRSAAAAARRLDLRPGDRLLAATDARPLNPVESPARSTLTDLESADPAGDLAGRLRELVGKPVTVRFRRGDKEEQVTLQPD